ncbi:DUF1800 domain-containing protein [Marinibacterium sp. SX1]|uniref:DUF1800 domain-containing protein n=1 Tax=Marinibacterium sp. SX1 TaxID=3388424 RepID=UPI003D184E1E
MTFSPYLAEIRFGCGLSPVLDPPADAAALLDGLSALDAMVQRHPIEDFAGFNERILRIQGLYRQRNEAGETAESDRLTEEIRALRRDTDQSRVRWAMQRCLRWAHTTTGFRERLVQFWADHFTATGKTDLMLYSNAAFVESAIRPNLAGRFADLLIAAVTHPVMLNALDQMNSAGPNSPAVARQKNLKGMNENLAREVLELHTLGAGGPYGQGDVREFAELLTGITYRAKHGGLRYFEGWAEPGAETLLGRTYGAEPGLDNIHDALTDLARHPATAAHVARKLAVHFVADRPDPDLVAHVERRFTETDGDLAQVYAALLEHPASWAPGLSNVKPPFDFMASAGRALNLPDEPAGQMDHGQLYGLLFAPLALMGQPWAEPSGPDGWPEEDEAWITPQGLSARMRWAMDAPQRFRPDLPDPREFVDQALGPYVTEPVRFAARAAESRSEAIGLVLSSPAFQRR